MIYENMILLTCILNTYAFLMSWFFAHNLHFAFVSLHVLIKCSKSWHLWHWLIRLFKNFVICRIFSFTINFVWIVLSASFLNLRLIFTNMCVLFFRLSARVNQIDSHASVTSLYILISFWKSLIELSYDAIFTSCTIDSKSDLVFLNRFNLKFDFSD